MSLRCHFGGFAFSASNVERATRHLRRCAQSLAAGTQLGHGLGLPVAGSLAVTRGSRGTVRGSSAAKYANNAMTLALKLSSSNTSLSKVSRLVCQVYAS